MNKRKQSIPQPKKKIANGGINYTKNKVLNELLNETAYASDEWETMGSETFTTDSMQSILNKSYSGMMNGGEKAIPNVMDDEMLINAGVNNRDAVPEHITKALTRDYSDLMKHIDKKKEI